MILFKWRCRWTSCWWSVSGRRRCRCVLVVVDGPHSDVTFCVAASLQDSDLLGVFHSSSCSSLFLPPPSLPSRRRRWSQGDAGTVDTTGRLWHLTDRGFHDWLLHASSLSLSSLLLLLSCTFYTIVPSKSVSGVAIGCEGSINQSMSLIGITAAQLDM